MTEQEPSLRQERALLLRNASWMSVARSLRTGEVLLRSIVIARSLGADSYAAYAVISAFPAPFLGLFNVQMGAALIKFGTEYREGGEREKLYALVKLAYLATLVLFLCFGLVVVLASLPLQGLLGKEHGVYPLVIAFSLASGLTLFDLVGKSLLVLHNRFRVNAIVDGVIATVNLTIVASAAFLWPQNLTAILLAVSTTLVIGPLVSNLAAVFEIRSLLVGWTRAKVSRLKPRYRELFRFTFGNSVAGALERSTKNMDVLILAAFAAPPVVAVYDIARKLSNVFLMLKDTITTAAFPQVASLLSGRQYSTFRSLLGSVYKVAWLPVLAVLLFFAVFDDWILSIWGGDFRDPGWIVLVMMLRCMVPLLCFWVLPLVLSLGLIRIRLVASVVSSTVGLGLAALLAGPFGGEGVAVAMLISVLLNQGILARAGLRAIPSGDEGERADAKPVL